jgi:hypothetical protein
MLCFLVSFLTISCGKSHLSKNILEVKMKKRIHLLITPILALLTLFLAVSCPAPDANTGGGSSIEFVGTWKYTAGLGNMTNTFTGTTCVLSNTVPPNSGTRTSDILSYDQTTNHMITRGTAQTGTYAPTTGFIGVDIYCTSLLSGLQTY